MTYFSILGFLNISGISKATNFLKFVNGDDGNLRAELPSWSRAKLIVGGAGKGDSGGFAKLVGQTKHLHHLHTCQSIFNFAYNIVKLFMNVLKMLKISQPVTFFPHPPLYQVAWRVKRVLYFHFRSKI